jgi:hypothetical protein
MKPRLSVTFSCLLALALLGGCAFAEDALWPSITGKAPTSQAQAPKRVVVTARADGASAASVPDDASYRAPGLTAADEDAPPGSDAQLQMTQALIAQQVDLDARDARLQVLRATRQTAVDGFANRAISINKRLRASTTPGDRALKAEWGKSRADLDVLDELGSQYRALAAENDAAATALAALLPEVRAEEATAAEDNQAGLAVLASDVEKTLAVVEGLSAALAQGSATLDAPATMAKLALAAMEVAIEGGAYVGDALAQRARGRAAPAPAGGGASLVGTTAPLAVISFADADAYFEAALFSIVYAALGRRPNAGFDLVGVSPSLDAAAAAAQDERDGAQIYTARLDTGRVNAQQVRRALLSMGLPAERMTLAATNSPAARAEEVHIYVR